MCHTANCVEQREVDDVHEFTQTAIGLNDDNKLLIIFFIYGGVECFTRSCANI